MTLVALDSHAKSQRRRPHLLALEPRMMFDAAAAVVAQEVISDSRDTGDTHHAEPAVAHPADTAPPTSDAQRTPTNESREIVDAAPEQTTKATSHDVIFIDTSVADYRQLAAEWADRGQIVLIDGTQDGIAQMQSALAGQSDIGAIHIVSHGSEGMFWLGTTRVDSVAIQGTLAASLGQIGATLAPGGDILIYGCDFAEGADGAAALAAFAQATHADVAASTDVTGYAGRGGDWMLESHRGSIEARTLSSDDWVHTLDPNTPVPIAVTANSLTVTNGAGNVVVNGTTGYGNDGRSPDVGVGAVAVWRGAATFNGQAVDLRATVVSISAGDAVRFNRPTGTGVNGDDPTFLLRDLTAANDATVQIRWELVLGGTNTALPADVRFTIADIDGIGGNPNTRESVTAATTGLAYYTRERDSDINFVSSLNAITASGTRDENTDATLPVTPKSAATYDWSDVSSFTLTYKLTTNTVTTNAQFIHDGDADFVYTNPVYVSVPRLDLDGNDSTASGNDAHFTFTENGPGVPIVDADVVVSNPMDINSITGAAVRLTNYQAGDTFTIGTLPSNITATIGAVSGGAQVITLTGNGSESDYAAAFRAITYSNTSDTPATVQRVIDISFSNDTLTSAIATSRIDVIPVNDAPTARNDAVTTPEDTVVTFAVLGNDTDPEGDALTVTAASALHGAVMRNADGTLTYMPSPDYNGADTITYTISDGRGGTSTATVAVTVTPVNDAPDAVATLPSRSASDADTVSYPTAGAFTDRDGDTLLYAATGLPAGLAIDANTGVISGTIDRSASQAGDGSYTVTVTARDPSNASATRDFTLTVANPTPTATDDSATTAEATPVTITVLGNDSDPDRDPLTVTSASALHGNVTINSDGTLRYTPNANYNGSDTISYAISDGQGGTASAKVAVTITPVNDAPAAAGTLPGLASLDAATVSYPTAGGFSDVDGDTLSYAATGLPAGLTINATTGVISGTIDRSASQIGNGTYTVIVTARDPSNATTTQSFVLTVGNPAPTAVNDSATTAEDTPVTIAVLGNDSDPDGDPLTVTSASALNGSVTINPDGTLRYTPNANYNGSDTISYALSDGQGGTAAAQVAVTITPANDAPTTAGSLPSRATVDAASVAYPTAAAFADVDGDALSYTATGLPAGLTINAATGVISGTVDRSASQLNGGVYTVVVTAQDPSNARATQSFTLSVANPAPIARNDGASTTEDTPVTIVVLANDSDPDGDPLIVTSASALNGSVTINPDGTLRYTPNANYNGSDTISYTISDGQGGTAAAQVAVTIAPVNDAPDTVGTLPGRSASDAQTVSYPTAGAFADIDGDTLRYSADNLPAGLSIDPATGIISGTIDRSASTSGGGQYTVVVTATDPSGAFARQNFTLDIANPAPIARDDAVRTHVGMPVTVAVLANDTDPDGDPLTVTGAVAANGSVSINPDGSLTYTPRTGFQGRDTVSYTISDGQGGSASATLTIDVANAAPTAAPIAPVSASDGQAVTLPVGAGFGDADGDQLTFTATGLPPGLSIDPATGTISGTITRSASQSNNGVYDTVVTASDGFGGSVSTTFRWTVANPAPIARDDAATTNEDAPIVIVVLGNDSDPDGDPLTVTAAVAAHGSVTINPDGTMTYRPDADFNGTDQIRYTISDGDGGQSTAIVSVNVVPVNDAPTTTGLPERITADGITVNKPFAPSFADPDGDALTYSATGLPPGLSIDPATGIVSGTITPGSANGGPGGNGVYHAVVTATDPSGASITAPFDWTVSQTAPLAADDTATTPEDTPITIPVLANDSDADNDPLTIVDAVATHGDVAIVGGNLVFTPATDFNGTAAIVYTVSDPAGNRATATVTVDVTPVNDAPIVTQLPTSRASDGQPVTLDVGGFFRDPDGDTLSYAANGLPPGLSIDPATGQISGTIDRSASQTSGGVYRVTVSATDPSGATSSSSFDWTIVNPAPIARDDVAITAEDTSVTIAVLPNDSDPDGDPLTVISASASHGSVTIGADGTLRYTPAVDFNGNDVIVYTIDDGNGGRATASVLVTVTPVNDAPVATLPSQPDLLTTDGATLAIDVGGWFGDVDNDALRYTATGLPAGLSIDPATGAISGTIDRSASQVAGGSYAVTVTATDLNGAAAETKLTLTVANPAPVAADDVARAPQDSSGIVIPVLANDRDPDGDPLIVTGATATNGSATIDPDGNIRYVPGPGFSGTDIVSYTISDGQGGTATARVTITVDPANRAPVIVGVDPVDARGGQPVTIDVRPGVMDPDGDPVIVTGATTATGVVQVNPDGTIGYTPPLGFSGTTTIGYTISDGRGGTTTGTIIVRVTPAATADVEQLLRIGHVSFRDPAPALALVTVHDGTIRNPLSLIQTVDDIRSLRGTSIGEQPVGDAVEAMRSLRGTYIDPDAPITAEVARLDALRDQRDAGDKLFDHRWGDFMVAGLTGFSAAADRNACIMVESVVRGGAIYLEVRDTAAEGTRAAVRSIDVRLAGGGRPAWIKVDPRGLAIIERGADMDEMHLVVRVTRSDGSTSSTPILLQGQTGEVELDRHHAARAHAAPLDATLHTPSAAIQAEAIRLAGLFQ